MLAQTHPGTELVVVDDGSTDGTAAVLARYDGRLQALRLEENRGPAAARNRALGIARGCYVAFLDADDRYLPEKLARQQEVLATRPEVGIVYTGWHFIDEEGRRFGRPAVLREEGTLLPDLLLGNLIHLVAVMVRRDLVAAAGGFDESLRYNEDWDLFLRLSSRGAVWAAVPESLWEYRVHAGQATRQAIAMLADRVRILERTFAGSLVPEALRGQRPLAFARAYLLGAGECFRAGAVAEGHEAFHAAARSHPDWLGDWKSLLWFCRALRPPGRQHLADLAAAAPEIAGRLSDALSTLFARPDLERGIRRLRVRAWLAALRVQLRLRRIRWTGGPPR